MEQKENKICFKEYEKECFDCQKTSCKFWIPSESNNNCTIIASKKGPHTLQEIGDIFSVTRMRICQIEKSIFQKLKSLSSLNQI
tara:strand:+ start:607 stop:858 length:252 start_codon:yes stop_codon:yes gene_type:complete